MMHGYNTGNFLMGGGLIWGLVPIGPGDSDHLCGLAIDSEQARLFFS